MIRKVYFITLIIFTFFFLVILIYLINKNTKELNIFYWFAQVFANNVWFFRINKGHCKFQFKRFVENPISKPIICLIVDLNS